MKRGQAPMYLSQPNHANFRKFVDRDGTAKNTADPGMYSWSRGIQRLAKYEPDHPLNTDTKTQSFFQAFEPQALPTPYRDLVAEFQSGMEQGDPLVGAVQVPSAELISQEDIQKRFAEIEAEIPQGIRGRDEVIKMLQQQYLIDRVQRRGDAGINLARTEGERVGRESGRTAVIRDMESAELNRLQSQFINRPARASRVAMGIDNLRRLATLLGISSTGTANELISRIENKLGQSLSAGRDQYGGRVGGDDADVATVSSAGIESVSQREQPTASGAAGEDMGAFADNEMDAEQKERVEAAKRRIVKMRKEANRQQTARAIGQALGERLGGRVAERISEFL